MAQSRFRSLLDNELVARWLMIKLVSCMFRNSSAVFITITDWILFLICLRLCFL